MLLKIQILHLFIIITISIFSLRASDNIDNYKNLLSEKTSKKEYDSEYISTVDSLILVSRKSDIDKNLIEAYNFRLKYFLNINNKDSIIGCFESIRELSSKIKDINNIISTYKAQSNYYYDIDNYESSDSLLRQAIDIYGTFESSRFAEIYRLIGKTNVELSNYDKAIKYFTKAKELALKYDDQKEYHIVISNIANYYRRIGQIDESIKLEKFVYDYFDKINSDLTGDYASDIGYLYLYKMEDDKRFIDSARKYLDEAIEYAFKINDSSTIANTYLLYSSIFNIENKQDSNLRLIKNALEINLNINNKGGIINCYDMLGTYYFNLAKNSKNYNEIQRSINNSIFYLKKTSHQLVGSKKDTLVYYEIYKIIADGYEKLGKKDSALHYFKEYLKRFEIAKNLQTDESIHKILNDHSIEIRNRELELKELEVQKTTNQSLILIIASTLLLLSILIILFLYRKNNELLYKILPKKIAHKLGNKNQNVAEHHYDVAVIFIDMVGFSSYSKGKQPEQIVELLNSVFKKMDSIAKDYDVEKIKTIGDCYLAATSIPEPVDDALEKMASFALKVLQEFSDYSSKDHWKVAFRIGIDFGEVVAGVIGEDKFLYDIWGQTVNTASTLEETGSVNKIHVTKNIVDRIDNNFIFEDKGYTELKGIGKTNTYFLVGSKT